MLARLLPPSKVVVGAQLALGSAMVKPQHGSAASVMHRRTELGEPGNRQPDLHNRLGLAMVQMSTRAHDASVRGEASERLAAMYYETLRKTVQIEKEKGYQVSLSNCHGRRY